MEKTKVFDLLNKFLICKYIGKLIKTDNKAVKLNPCFPNSSKANLINSKTFVMIDDLSSFVGIQGKERLN